MVSGYCYCVCAVSKLSKETEGLIYIYSTTKDSMRVYIVSYTMGMY
jgi:hypothetical protein